MQVFISYSRADKEIATKLADDLAKYEITIWMDVRNIPHGSNWDIEVQKGLDASDVMLVLLSPDSAASENVTDEWSYFLENDKQLYPLLIRPCTVPFRLLRRQRVDLTQDYAAGFRQVLRTLGNPKALDAEATRPLSSVKPSATRPSAGSQTLILENQIKSLPVVWGEQYHWLNGLRGGTEGEALVNERELLLIPSRGPLLSIQFPSIQTAKLSGALDKYVELRFLGAGGKPQQLLVMGAVRPKRTAISAEMLGLLSERSNRTLD